MDYILEGVIGAFQLLLSGHEETYSAVATTLKVSTLSIAICLLVGIPLGFLLGYGHFPGKRALRTVVDTLLALPTVVVGLLVYAFITRRGPLGEIGLLFTIPGIAIGQFILALPIVVSLTASAVEELDPKLRLTLKTLGATKRQVALSSLWEGRYSVMVSAVTAYGRVISEVGVSMMLGGNIKWHTRTITTAIALETGKGQFSMGIALGLVLLTLAFAVNTAVSVLRRRA
ncbi:MAG TPA: ABC transporter permease [Synergistaceae bacterium]|jgi:tungstate transport system permease protein|nr:MAG: Binding-protein-dependent transport systems inner membrane component [Synergistales bacterium 53_16]KUL04147.1 MAG: Binding-protein-dependent transport systems inner membrane component [Synergistales bacterium 54_9]MDK2845441.1 tungstate transport system permease protein [Synergistales bacterium]HAA47388.1 ABC transporter permease [Synergistaceae bacterium]HAG22838.1 ABC transporter permease [Synergistaceae bacterium]